MNTNKIYAESVAKEYAVKDESKVVALRKPDNRVQNADRRTYRIDYGLRGNKN